MDRDVCSICGKVAHEDEIFSTYHNAGKAYIVCSTRCLLKASGNDGCESTSQEP